MTPRPILPLPFAVVPARPAERTRVSARGAYQLALHGYARILDLRVGAEPFPLGQPTPPTDLVRVARQHAAVILLSERGVATPALAAALREQGIDAVDVVDGFAGWAEAGLPT